MSSYAWHLICTGDADLNHVDDSQESSFLELEQQDDREYFTYNAITV